MEIDKLNSLVELYFKKCDEVDPNRPFLKWLKPNKPTYTWGDIKERIFKLSTKIKTLINEFNLIVGYSDHTSGIEVPIAAVALGARVIEKHITLDKKSIGPDHKASIEPNELKKMIVDYNVILQGFSNKNTSEKIAQDLVNNLK